MSEGLATPAHPWLRRPVVIAVLASLVALALRVPWSGGPYSRDEAAAMTVAREMLHGQLPNVTAWQQRHPGTYVFYAAAALLPVDPDTQLDVLAGLAVVATIAALVWWLSALVTPGWVVFGALLFAALSCDPAMQGQTANTELLINPFLTASLAALTVAVRSGSIRLFVLAGVLAGVPATIKEHTALVPILLAAAILLFSAAPLRRRFAQGFVFGAASAAPWLLLLGVYWSSGHVGIIWETASFNLGHALFEPRDLVAGPLLLLRNANAMYSTWPVWLTAGAGLVCCRWRRETVPLRVYFVSSMLLIVLPGYYFNHYYLLALPAIVAMSVVFLDEVSRRSRLVAGTIALLLGTFVGGMQLLFATGHLPRAVRQYVPTGAAIGADTKSQREFARALGRASREGDTLLIYGVDHQFFLYSGLRPSCPVLWLSAYDQRFFSDDAAARPFRDWALASLRSQPPDYVILQYELEGRRGLPVANQLGRMLAEGYRRVDPREIEPGVTADSLRAMHVVGVYRRRPVSGASPSH